MAAVTFAEAARRLGHRSRSSLYRLKAEHRLDHYLVEGPNRSQLLEMTPAERPTLESYLAAVLDPGRGPQASRREQRSQRDRRWELVAATLSAALEVIGGPSLTAKEAELLADRLGPATWETFPEGLPGGIPRDPPHPLSDGSPTIMDLLWAPLAKEANHWLVEGGWGFPRLTAEEVLLIWKAAEDWMEGTSFDTESEAWWREAMEDRTEGDPCPDPWRCQWCGKPWHGNHPDYERPAEVEAFWKTWLARLGSSKDIPEEASQELEAADSLEA